jgi:hypothetical protein
MKEESNDYAFLPENQRPEKSLKERGSRCSCDGRAGLWGDLTDALRLKWSVGCEEKRYDYSNRWVAIPLDSADRANPYR